MDDLTLKAKAVESAIFQALQNAASQPDKEEHWRYVAMKLENKFITQHGRHYSYFLERK